MENFTGFIAICACLLIYSILIWAITKMPNNVNCNKKDNRTIEQIQDNNKLQEKLNNQLQESLTNFPFC